VQPASSRRRFGCPRHARAAPQRRPVHGGYPDATLSARLPDRRPPARAAPCLPAFFACPRHRWTPRTASGYAFGGTRGRTVSRLAHPSGWPPIRCCPETSNATARQPRALVRTSTQESLTESDTVGLQIHGGATDSQVARSRSPVATRHPSSASAPPSVLRVRDEDRATAVTRPCFERVCDV
jgi:hypothetical protein